MGCVEENLKTGKKAKEQDRVSRRDAEVAEGKYKKCESRIFKSKPNWSHAKPPRRKEKNWTGLLAASRKRKR